MIYRTEEVTRAFGAPSSALDRGEQDFRGSPKGKALPELEQEYVPGLRIRWQQFVQSFETKTGKPNVELCVIYQSFQTDSPNLAKYSATFC